MNMKSGLSHRFEGSWTLHTRIGERVFDDRLRLSRQEDGELSGELSVPGGFTAPVEDLVLSETGLSFEINPDEGNGPFEVDYSAIYDAKRDMLLGTATLADGKRLGGFVGVRSQNFGKA